MIPFNVPFTNKTELDFVADAIARKQFSGGGYYTRQCEAWLKDFTGSSKVLLTSSCTHALEMCALLCGIQPGDEVIMSSFNFVSAANAFVLRGAKIVFVDIRPDTMNIDENLIEPAITKRTKAILAMHYGGVACEMDRIMEIACDHNLIVIEDAAHCIGAKYKGKHLGTIGHLGTLSFHATKNIQCGEGGALLMNEKQYFDKADIIIEKGTNRKNSNEGRVCKYSWVEIGSSYLMSELSAAFLFAQFSSVMEVLEKRRQLWFEYYRELLPLAKHGKIGLPVVGDICFFNGHLFYLKCKSEDQLKMLSSHLGMHKIESAFHYVPLHNSIAGIKYGRFIFDEDRTGRESSRLLRLPIYFGLEPISTITEAVKTFFYEGSVSH